MYTPLHVHTHYSLLDGLSKPQAIADRCKKLDIKSCAITDHGTIAGNIDFFKTMKANNIKAIMGCELYICQNAGAEIKNKANQKLSHMVVLAKNYEGWRNLIQLVSLSNKQEYFYHKPRLDCNLLREHVTKDLICITGHPGSTLANLIYDYETQSFLDNWESSAINHVRDLKNIFGESNVYIEIQLMDQKNKDQQSIGKKLREFAKQNKIQRVATVDAHYCEKDDAVDQRILLCSAMKTTLPKITQKILNEEKVPMSTFFSSDMYYILSPEEMLELHEEEEIANTIAIDKQCEEYEILQAPRLPTFICPENKKPIDYLRELCRIGWLQKIKNNIEHPHTEEEYLVRIKNELKVLEEANLASYFLIIKDIVDYIKSIGCLPGPGRGSAAGCLVSYLLGITAIDPIKYGLIFERFYNAGRNTKDRVSMPDIDVDVPIEQRESIIEYIKNKYGLSQVSQMITFNTLKGRGALKEVLRTHGNISFEEMNKITKAIPDEARIADELQLMKDNNQESSIIRWALENNSKALQEWCEISEDGNLSGPLSKRFEQAIRMEGCKYNQSKHAAGIAIASEPLETICPMIWDNKTKKNIAGFEMGDLESIGVVKFDILGIALLDKVLCVKQMLMRG